MMIAYNEKRRMEMHFQTIKKTGNETKCNKNEINDSENENLWNLHKSEHTPLNNLPMESLYSVLYNKHVR